MDVISNSDLTSWIVHTEDIKKKKKTQTTTQQKFRINWSWHIIHRQMEMAGHKSSNECHSPKYRITANL